MADILEKSKVDPDQLMKFRSQFGRFQAFTKAGKKIQFVDGYFETKDKEIIDALRNIKDLQKGRPTIVEIFK